MDYYSTLGLNRNASDDDIKKAYRKMAMKYHPDRGGDEKKFKEVEEAYRTLSDPQKKQMFDMGVDPNKSQGNQGFYQNGPFEFHFNSNNMEDIFSNFGFGGFSRAPRNKNVSIKVEILLSDVLNGKDIDAEVSLPNGSKKIISINIPPGIEHGQQIRYQGMGENNIPGVRPGDLIVHVFVRPDNKFTRDHDNLICEHKISVYDAMIGTSIDVTTIDNKTLKINIPAGTQPDTIFSCKGEGLPHVRSHRRGNLLIKIRTEIPQITNDKHKKIIEDLKHGRI